MSKWFFNTEVACKCGCGFTITNPVFLAKLDLLRDKLGRPVIVNSGARCMPHNAAVGGKPDSAHVTGLAVDISALSSQEKYQIIRQAIQCGFRRIGFHPKFIHLDVDAAKPQEVIWPY